MPHVDVRKANRHVSVLTSDGKRRSVKITAVGAGTNVTGTVYKAETHTDVAKDPARPFTVPSWRRS